MNNIHEMRKKRGEIWDRAKAFLTEHQDENGMLSAEDTAQYERMEQEVVDLGHAIERAERADALEREMNAPTAPPLASRPEARPNQRTGRSSDEYKSAFWTAMRSRGGHFSVQNALQIGTDSEGGYLAPDEYQKTLIDALQDQNIIRPLANVIQTESGERKIPVVASHGTASWMDEEAAYTESDEAFGQVSIGAFKLGTMIKVSEELLRDSVFDLPTYIAKEFARRIGAAEEEAFLTGNGASKPTGLLNATGGAQTGVTATAQDAITFDEVMDLYYSLRAPYRRNAVFIMNDSTIKAIRKLKNGNGDYIWQPSVKAGTPDTILNRPVYTSVYMPQMAKGKKAMLFGDMSYYWIADRQGRSFKRLNELYAANGQVGFLASQRVDGKMILPEAVKVLVQKAS